MLNHVKHAAQAGRVGMLVDPWSSGPWFQHWPFGGRVPQRTPCTGPPPLVDAATYLLSHGWRRVPGAFIAPA